MKHKNIYGCSQVDWLPSAPRCDDAEEQGLKAQLREANERIRQLEARISRAGNLIRQVRALSVLGRVPQNSINQAIKLLERE